MNPHPELPVDSAIAPPPFHLPNPPRRILLVDDDRSARQLRTARMVLPVL